MNDNLSWEDHISTVTKRAVRRLYILRSNATKQQTLLKLRMQNRQNMKLFLPIHDTLHEQTVITPPSSPTHPTPALSTYTPICFTSVGVRNLTLYDFV